MNDKERLHCTGVIDTELIIIAKYTREEYLGFLR